MNITFIIILVLFTAFVIYSLTKTKNKSKENLQTTDKSNLPNSADFLQTIVEFIQPILVKNGFTYTSGQNSSSSGGPFANGFFKSDKVEIGFIVRGDRFGAVNYSVEKGNISHDDIFIIINKEVEKHLLYDEVQYKSYTLKNETLQEALLFDLENVVLPYIKEKSPEDIKSIIQKVYQKHWE